MSSDSKYSFLSSLKRGFLFYALSVLVIALQFVSYIFGNSILDLMDLEGWLFFIASCVSHASQVALIPFIVYVVFSASVSHVLVRFCISCW